MSTCKTASPPRRTFWKIESRKFYTMFQQPPPGNWSRFYRNFVCTLRKSTLKVDPGSQKWPKSVLLRKFEKLFLTPAKELVFSLKNFYLTVLTGKYHPRPGKNLHVEKNELKMTKNRFFGHGILTTFRESHFSTTKIEKTLTKYTLPKITLNTACNNVLILFLGRIG